MLRQEQKVIINAKTGKKKIMPKIERIFEDTNAKVNPHLNPFMQIDDHQESSAKQSVAKPLAPPLPQAPAEAVVKAPPPVPTTGAFTQMANP